MAKTKLEFSCMLTSKDVRELNRNITGRKGIIVALCFLFASLCLAVANAVSLHLSLANSLYSVFVTVGAMALILSLVILITDFIMYSKIRARHQGGDPIIDYAVDHKGVRYLLFGEPCIYRWEKLPSVFETKNLYIAKVNTANAIMFTKRDLPDEAALRQLLKEAVPAKRLKLKGEKK